jgi:hypothetical protein
LLALGGCKSELDDSPLADPIEDPWVEGIDSGAEPAAASELLTPEALALAEPETPGEPEALAEPEAPPVDVDAQAPAPAEPEAPASVLATPSAKPASAAAGSPAAEPPAAADEREPVVDAAPTPTPAPAAEPAVVAEKPKPAPPPPITPADFQGKYRFTGGSSQRKDLEQAIEAAAQQLSAAIRGIGRKRLTKTNPIDDTLEIVVAGDKLTTIFETGFDATCVIDGPTIHWSNNKGEKYKVRARQKGEKLIQIIQGDDGVKTTVFVLSADKQRLTVHHKITADRLPEPMTYRLSYSRR